MTPSEVHAHRVNPIWPDPHPQLFKNKLRFRLPYKDTVSSFRIPLIMKSPIPPSIMKFAPEREPMEEADMNQTRRPGLITIKEAGERWSRSPRSIQLEIETHDYREDNGVFFRHLDKREWRINPYLYLYWRRVPVSAAPDAAMIQNCDFLLQHTELPFHALASMRRLLLAQREARAALVDSVDPKQGTDHTGEKE
jgi:hypothetical protein